MAWRNDQQLFESLPVCLSLEFNYLSFFLALTTRALFSASLGSTHSLLFYLTHLLFYLELIASLAIVYPCKLSMVCGFYSKPFSHLQYSFPPGKKKTNKVDSQVQPNSPCFYLSPELSFGDATFWCECCVVHISSIIPGFFTTIFSCSSLLQLNKVLEMSSFPLAFPWAGFLRFEFFCS